MMKPEPSPHAVRMNTVARARRLDGIGCWRAGGQRCVRRGCTIVVPVGWRPDIVAAATAGVWLGVGTTHQVVDDGAGGHGGQHQRRRY